MFEIETDPQKLASRQKQIDIGMNTDGFRNLSKICSTLTKKELENRYIPRVPNKFQVCSKRCFDGQLKKWRRMLHEYDDPNVKEIFVFQEKK